MTLDNILQNKQIQEEMQADPSMGSNKIDFSTAHHPLGDLAGFNTDTLIDPASDLSDEQVDNTPPGTTDQTTDPTVIADASSSAAKARQLALSSNDSEIKYAKKIYNPSLPTQGYEFDQYKTNVDRYRGYGKGVFNSLGFNPLDDNESYYNANTTGWQDFKRMAGQWGGLFNTGFTSGYRAGYNFLTGKAGLFDADEQEAEIYDKAMRLGASSRGGGWEFTTNMALNLAYTSGIAANIAAEEFAIAAISSLTAEAAPATYSALEAANAPRRAVQIARMVRAFKSGATGVKAAFRGREVSQMFRGGFGMLRSLGRVNDAREFYSAFRTGAATFGRGAIGFLNPLRNSTDVYRGIRNGEAGYRNLTNFAKISSSFGGFYRDVRENLFAVSEAQLEGGGVYNRLVDENLELYRNTNDGQDPDAEGWSEIYRNAEAGGNLTTAINVPLIFVTNRVTFDGLFNIKGIKGLVEAGEKAAQKGVAKGVGFELSSRSLKDYSKNFLRTSLGMLTKPRIYAGAFLNYTKNNFMEGGQEILQEFTSGAVEKYYTDIYRDPSLAGIEYAKTSALASLGENVFSAKGANVFINGFLMGAAERIGPVNLAKGIVNKGGMLYAQKFKPEQYKAYVEAKTKAKEEAIRVANTLLSDPETFFSRKKESVVNQVRANQNMSQAELNDDDKSFHDAKDEKALDHIFTTLENGLFDEVIDGFKEMKNLTEDDLAKAFNISDGVKVKDKLDEYVGRAQQIKRNYETVQDKYPNPFNPKKFKAGSEEQIKEFIAFKSFEDAKKTAIASQYGFERALQRMVSVFSDLQTEKPIAKSSAADYTVLQNVNSITNEIRLIKQEIKALEGITDPEVKKLVSDKTKKLNALEEYSKHLNTHLSNTKLGKVDVATGQITLGFEDDTSITDLRKSFDNYLKVVAELNNDYVFNDKVDSAFKKILDYYSLDDDAKKYSEVVNKLSDPNNLLKYSEIIDSRLSEIFENKDKYIAEGLDNYFGVIELNNMTLALAKLGVTLNPADLENLARTGNPPTSFFDLRKGTVIEKNDPRYESLVDIVNTFSKLKNNVSPEEAAGEETKPVEEPAKPTAAQPTGAPVTPAPVTPTPVAPSTPTETPKDLMARYQAGYNSFMEDNPGSDLSFDDYISTTRAASRIRKDYEAEKGVTTPKPAQPAPATPATPIAPAAPPVTPAPITPTPAPVSTDVISEEVYNQFVDSNIVPQDVLNSIADKVIARKPLSQRETAIFTGKTSEINELIKNKSAVSTTAKQKVVKVYHHTNVAPQDFDFGTFQRGKQQVSQFGDGLNASSTTTPFLVKRYGNPIEGEINDSDFIIIDANKSEKELYEELKTKGYKFNNPDRGSYIGNDPAKEYDGTEKANEQPAIISLFNDFQKSNPEVKGVKVINHIIGNQKVDPFYVIYDAKSFYGPGSLSKTQPTVSTDAKADIEKRRKQSRASFQESVASGGFGVEVNWQYYKADGTIESYSTSGRKNAEEELNRKFDAELKALEKTPVSKDASPVTNIGPGTSVKINISNSSFNVDLKTFKQTGDTIELSYINRYGVQVGYRGNYKSGIFYPTENFNPKSGWTPLSTATFVSIELPTVSTDTKADVEKIKQTLEGKEIENRRSLTTVSDEASAEDNYDGYYENTVKPSGSDEFVKTGEWIGTYINKTGEKEEVVANSEKELLDILNAKYDAELAALEQTTAPSDFYEEFSEEIKASNQRAKDEEAAQFEFNNILDSISSLSQLPNDKLTDNTNATKDILALVAQGNLEPQQVLQALAVKRDELISKIELSDLQNNDYITFRDGRKGYIKSTNAKNKTVRIKMVGSEKGEVATMPANEFFSKLQNIEKDKVVKKQDTPEVVVSEEDKQEISASRDATDQFTSNAASIQKANDEVLNNPGQDNMKNLIDQLGCKTGK